jgi:shikimate dehydrogenase
MEKRYGLIGQSLGHSFSQSFFQNKFEKEGIQARYDNFEIQQVDGILELILNEGLSGLNVTIPYKEQVMGLLDELDDVAQEIGAVNTIQIHQGKTKGFNTDAYGFQQSIKPFFRNIHERALILGTGGASKAVAYTLENLGVEVYYLSRDPRNNNEFHYTDANSIMINSFKLLVNTTPLGTYPNVDEVPPIPLDAFTPDHLVIDLIYNPEKTRLLAAAEAQGSDILNGLSMLKHQALKSWEIWNSHE